MLKSFERIRRPLSRDRSIQEVDEFRGVQIAGLQTLNREALKFPRPIKRGGGAACNGVGGWFAAADLGEGSICLWSKQPFLGKETGGVGAALKFHCQLAPRQAGRIHLNREIVQIALPGLAG